MRPYNVCNHFLNGVSDLETDCGSSSSQFVSSSSQFVSNNTVEISPASLSKLVYESEFPFVTYTAHLYLDDEEMDRQMRILCTPVQEKCSNNPDYVPLNVNIKTSEPHNMRSDSSSDQTIPDDFIDFDLLENIEETEWSPEDLECLKSLSELFPSVSDQVGLESCTENLPNVPVEKSDQQSGPLDLSVIKVEICSSGKRSISASGVSEQNQTQIMKEESESNKTHIDGPFEDKTLPIKKRKYPPIEELKPDVPKPISNTNSRRKRRRGRRRWGKRRRN